MIRRYYLARSWHTTPACHACRALQAAADAGTWLLFAASGIRQPLRTH